MSMKHSGVDEYGLSFDIATLEHMAKKFFVSTPSFENEFVETEWACNMDEYLSIMQDAGLLESESEFTGECVSIRENGQEDWNKVSNYENEPIYYVRLKKWPSLVEAPYKNMEEIVQELRAAVGKYLPDDYDYAGNLQHIVGTYYG